VRVKLNLIFLLLVFITVLNGCASTLDQDDALAVVPYHIVSDGRIVVEARVNDQGPFAFALDTGASISVIFDKLRDELELETSSQSVIIHSLFASDTFPLLAVDSLQLGQETWAKPRIVALPGETGAATSIDGVLGIDFLRQYAVGFSAEDHAVRLYSPDIVRDRSYRGWAVVPLTSKSIGSGRASLYFFDVTINGRTVSALFDLGTGVNLINWPAARELRLKPLDQTADDILSGAVKSALIAAELNAKNVMTAGIRWRNEVFLIADLEIFSVLQQDDLPLVILGSRLFNQRDFIIDFVRNRLLVKVSMREIDGG